MLEVPGYRIERELGRGGMATVYLATQLSLSRHVALKMLAPALADDPVATERFLREAQIAAKLHHSNIVEIHDVGSVDGKPYMAMAYEPGGTVTQVHIDSADQALRVARDIASALDYAHRLGVVHRDVKPENILRRADGAFVLSDFGIARASESTLALTGEGASVGTPHYMSPEQWRGEVVDGRADLYGLGIVLYRLLTGELPFRASDGYAIGLQHLHAPVPALPAPLAHLQPLIEDLLSKNTSTRCHTGAEVIRRIDAHLSGPRETIHHLLPAARVNVDHHSQTQPLPKAPQASRLPSVSTWAAITLIFLIAVLAWQPWRRNQSPTAAAADVAAPVATSIAVLPFIDLSEARDQAHFSDGLAEELLDSLARLPTLRVAGRTSAFSFRDRQDDLKAIGAKLGVAKVLQGSVRKSGTRLRVSVRLLNCADGFQVWSETYERELTDVFAIQDEIAQSVVHAFELKLLGDQPAPTARTPLPAAYTEYLQARQLLQRGSPTTASAAVDALLRAVAIDPQFAGAQARLGQAQMWAANYAESAADMARLQQQALASAERAIALDPGLGDGYVVRANLRASVTWEWLGARSDFNRALSIDPQHPQAQQGYGSLLASLGQLPTAIDLTRRVTEREPLMPSAWQALGYFQEAAGDFESARQSQKRALALKPEFPFAHFRLAVMSLAAKDVDQAAREFAATGYEPLQWVGDALVAHARGDERASLRALRLLVEKYADNAAYQIAQVHAGRNDADAAMLWLNRASQQRDGGLAEIKYDPLLAGLSNDERYRALLVKLGLPN